MPQEAADRPDRVEYSKEEARSIFQKALKGGSARLGRYVRLRMREREVDNNDILHLAKSGLVLNPPEPHIKTGELNYRIESQTQKLKVVFSIVDPNTVRLITVLDD